jgi:hypothetical protein
MQARASSSASSRTCAALGRRERMASTTSAASCCPAAFRVGEASPGEPAQVSPPDCPSSITVQIHCGLAQPPQAVSGLRQALEGRERGRGLGGEMVRGARERVSASGLCC